MSSRRLFAAAALGAAALAGAMLAGAMLAGAMLAACGPTLPWLDNPNAGSTNPSAMGGPAPTTAMPAADASAALASNPDSAIAQTPPPEGDGWVQPTVCPVDQLEQCAAECKAGNALSCNNLGALYEMGQIVAADRPRALQSYESSCHLGAEAGCKNATRLGAELGKPSDSGLKDGPFNPADGWR